MSHRMKQFTPESTKVRNFIAHRNRAFAPLLTPPRCGQPNQAQVERHGARTSLGREEGQGLEARAPDRPKQRCEARPTRQSASSLKRSQNREAQLAQACGISNHID